MSIYHYVSGSYGAQLEIYDLMGFFRYFRLYEKESEKNYLLHSNWHSKYRYWIEPLYLKIGCNDKILKLSLWGANEILSQGILTLMAIYWLCIYYEENRTEKKRCSVQMAERDEISVSLERYPGEKTHSDIFLLIQDKTH